MAILPKIQEPDASPEVQATYAKIKARYGGFLPDIYKAFANDPEYLDSLNDHIVTNRHRLAMPAYRGRIEAGAPPWPSTRMPR